MMVIWGKMSTEFGIEADNANYQYKELEHRYVDIEIDI